MPVAGCGCEVCRSVDTRDKRLRSSALVSWGSRKLVIDTGPEFRMQCIRAGVMNLDSVLITHDHVDHLNGLDDLRAYSMFKRKTLPVWGSHETLDAIRLRFAYIWNPPQTGGGLPDIELKEVDGPFETMGLQVTPIPIKHGVLDILGFRIGDLAYMTDISELPESSRPLLDDLGTMVISCVRYRYHRTHFNIAQAKELHRQVKPRQTLLTHLTHYISHRELASVVSPGMAPAFDGMRVEINL